MRPTGQQKDVAAAVKRGLYLDDAVTTGADGATQIAFPGGNVVELGPNTTLVIRQGGGTAAEMGAILLSGSLRMRSPGRGVLLSIGTPFGLVKTGMTLSVLDVSLDKGVSVSVGRVEVANGKTTHAVPAGQALTLDGLVVGLTGSVPGLDLAVAAPAAPRDVVLNPIVVTLMSKTRTTQIQRAGQKTWEPVPKNVALQPGDQLRVNKGGKAHVDFGDKATLTLPGGSAMLLKAAGEAADRQEATYALQHGALKIDITRSTAQTVKHTVEVAGAKLVVEPPERHANVEVTTAKTGAQVAIRAGQVSINDGQAIDRGVLVPIADGQAVSGGRDLTDYKVAVNLGVNSRIHYLGKPPAVNFVWSEAAGTSALFEVATDPDFYDIVAAERMSRGNLCLDQLPLAKYYWRINKDNRTRGSVQFVAETDRDCANCQRVNVINDTGEKTIVYFQQTLPAVSLRWKPVDAAALYTVKVFADGEFDKPLFLSTSTVPHLEFDEGQFKEGRFFWLVEASDSNGREIVTGQMNSLHVVYDNVITSLIIRSPIEGSVFKTAKIAVSGEVELRTKLMINEKSVAVDAQGRFSETVSLQPGANLIVFRMKAPDKSESIYTRNVQRRG